MAFAAIAGGALALGGGVLGAQSASNSAKKQIQAGKDALNFQQNQYDLGAVRAILTQYGPVEGKKQIKALYGDQVYGKIFGTPAKSESFNDDQRKQLDYINAQLAKPTYVPGVGNPLLRLAGNTSGSNSDNSVTREQRASLEKQKADLLKLAGGDPGSTGVLDNASVDALGPGIVTQQQQFADQYKTQGRDRLANFDQETQQLLADNNAQQRRVDRFGQQQADQYKTLAQQSLTGNNRLTEARLAARGLQGSSALTQGLQGNSLASNQQLSGQLAGLADQRLQYGLQVGAQGTALRSARTNSRDAYQSDLDNTQNSLNQQPISTRLQFATGSITNPWLSNNAAQYFSSASPSAAFGQSLAASTSALGGQLLNYGLTANRGNSGGGGIGPEGYSGSGYGNTYGTLNHDQLNDIKGY
jgi:hypothetical protein